MGSGDSSSDSLDRHKQVLRRQALLMGFFLLVMAGIYMYIVVVGRCKHRDEFECAASEKVQMACGEEPGLKFPDDCNAFIKYETCVCKKCGPCLSTRFADFCRKSADKRKAECKSTMAKAR